VFFRALLFFGFLGISFDTYAGCGDFLARMTGLNFLAPKVDLYQLLDQNLEPIRAKEQLKTSILRLKELRVISPLHAKDLFQILQNNPCSFLDPNFAENIYAKEWSELKLRDALMKLEEMHLSEFKLKLDQLQIRDWPRGTRTAYKAARLTTGFLVAAIILGGLSSIFSRAGAPFVDYAAAWVNRMAFAISPTGAQDRESSVSDFESGKASQLDSQYGITNKHWSPVQQAAGNRVSYFETTLLNADIDLSLNALLEAKTGVSNLSKRVTILQQLQSNCIRFSDVLITEEGHHARELLEQIQKQFDPEKEILKDLTRDSRTSSDDDQSAKGSK